jgi:hypothetical protein
MKKYHKFRMKAWDGDNKLYQRCIKCWMAVGGDTPAPRVGCTKDEIIPAYQHLANEKDSNI